MESLAKPQDPEDLIGTSNPRDTVIQIALSAALGLGAFLAFCILRPRWKSLYAARKQQRQEASPLPDLPDSIFGWILVLWKITEQQVLASAGLDAYVFLRFFKVATKFLAVTLFFALAILKPVHDAYPEKTDTGKSNSSHNESISYSTLHKPIAINQNFTILKSDGGSFYDHISTDYLWMYLVFAYLFTALAVYLLVTETEHIIGVRQEYLGYQSTITDRTIRLSGIPKELRSEEQIKEFIEGLQIGKVESILLCRDWRKLDERLTVRNQLLRKLEVVWAKYARLCRENKFRAPSAIESRYRDEDTTDVVDEEAGPLLSHGERQNGASDTSENTNVRPRKTIKYGFLYLSSRKVDAIEYYEEQLHRLDEEINTLRRQDFTPMPLAFVTMDSVAACQMAVQAVLNSSPRRLIAHLSPAPGDVVWPNTYMSRRARTTRAWMITIIIFVLSIFWILVLVPLATALNLSSIHEVWPELADTLRKHPFAKSLISTQFPTLFSTLLFVAVPYVYDWLANHQGTISQGDVELSVISKNFFFVFFNYFVVFTILGVFSTFYDLFDRFQKSLKDTTKVAYTLAQSLQRLLPFYTNLVILQGVGLMPFRLLEFGTVALTPIYRLSAKTPRDYAELSQTPEFYYGFYLPQVLLIFIICIVYSVIRDSWKVLLSGLIYFLIGGFVYKYQLLYAMENRQHSTGRAWVLICNRVIVGLVLFQLTTAGQLALQTAFKRAAAIVPLMVMTIWFYYLYRKSYNPLMRYISLSSIVRNRPEEIIDPDGWSEQYRNRYQREVRPGHTVDESEETGRRFVNPALVKPLEEPWLASEEARPVDRRRRLGLESAINAAT